MALTVITYGGGEFLQKVFQSVSMLFNGGEGGIIRPLMIITASLGGFYTFSKALLAPSYETILLRYCFPLIVFSSLLMVPSGTVHIEDVLKKVESGGPLRTSFYTVDHVPLLLARFAETASSIGFKISTAMESVMHLPNDPSYNSTGMIFGSQAALDMSNYRISNANLEQDIRAFSKQCVIYDIALGRYTLDDVKKSADLWKFFEERTSKVRMMRYSPPDAGPGLDKITYTSCKDAVTKMKPFLDKEKEKYAKLEIGKHLPITFQALTKMQKDSKELIGQLLTMNVLTDELSRGTFAQKRAHQQQQSTYLTLGGLAANGLVFMRIVFESLIYASFVLIVPLAMLPGGLKILFTWAQLVVWIQLWPPMYTILNYIALIAARYNLNGWFSGLSHDQQGLSLFVSNGMLTLTQDVFAMAGFLSLSVPYLSYVLLQGGLSSFVQLSGSLMAPAQSAASSAANEAVTGNYSFANTSFGQRSFENSSAFQMQQAPHFSDGHFVDNHGDIATTYSRDGSAIFNQQSSILRTSVAIDRAFGDNLQIQTQTAQSTLDTASENYSYSISECARDTADFVTHIANSKNASDSISGRDGYSVQDSANYILSHAENFAHQHGLSTSEAANLLCGVGYSGFIASGNLGCSRGASRDDLINFALNEAESDTFQKHLQRVKDYAKSETASESHDSGDRRSSALAHSIDQVSNYQDAYQTAKSHLEQVSRNEADFHQNSHAIRKSLNDDFIRWASESIPGGHSALREIIARDNSSEIDCLVEEYMVARGWKKPMIAVFEDHTHWGDQAKTKHDLNKNIVRLSADLDKSIIRAEKDQKFNALNGRLHDEYGLMEHTTSTKIEDTMVETKYARDKREKKFEIENGRYLAGRAASGPRANSDICSGSSFTNKEKSALHAED